MLLTLRHALRASEVVPDHWYSPAITLGILISSLCSRVVKEEMRLPWDLKLPTPLVYFVAFLLSVDWSLEFFLSLELFEVFEEDNDLYDWMEHGARFAHHLRMHFTFWVLLFVQATDISQVLLPMLLLVRPVQCVLLVVALLTAKLPRGE